MRRTVTRARAAIELRCDFPKDGRDSEGTSSLHYLRRICVFLTALNFVQT